MLPKPIIAFFILLLSVTALFAQVEQGVITYEVRMDMHRNLPEDRQELKNMIPQFRTDTFKLYFTPAASLYKIQEEVAPQSMGGRGGGMRMMMRMPRAVTHINRVSRERTFALDFLGTNYLVTDTLGIEPWKFGNEQVEIAGYMCMMAWYTDTVSNQEVTAWFTPLVTPFLGPDKYNTLPGTVLAVDINNGERVWVARKIEARAVTAEELQKPTRGEKMTRAQFEKFVSEQQQRMNPGGRQIRVF